MSTSPHSDTTTAGIRIQAAADFQPTQSEPARRRFVFRYHITMTNVGAPPAKLLSRHWLIVDGDGKREDVRGPGVVGDNPQLAIGESYSYVSYCSLATPWGTMEGTYTFERGDGSRFVVRVGRFLLVPTAPPLALESPQH
ncbi:MAG: Co2+/Mg2+ efflux protein ApaG [Planctomycetes bacterium]|nr:Co2+/Mg2+ efflux protein ApaG [Planctomycetota bacterium]